MIADRRDAVTHSADRRYREVRVVFGVCEALERCVGRTGDGGGDRTWL